MTTNIEKIIKQLENSTGDQRLRLLNELSDQYRSNSIKTALKYAKEAYALQSECDSLEDRINTFRKLGSLSMNSGDMESARNLFSEGFTLAQSEDDLTSMAYMILCKCEFFLRNSDHLAVMEIIREFSAEMNDLPDQGIKARTNQYLGLAHDGLAQFDKALDHHLKALKYAEKTGDEILEGSIHLNIGNTLMKMQNFEKAHDHYQVALSKAV